MGNVSEKKHEIVAFYLQKKNILINRTTSEYEYAKKYAETPFK